MIRCTPYWCIVEPCLIQDSLIILEWISVFKRIVGVSDSMTHSWSNPFIWINWLSEQFSDSVKDSRLFHQWMKWIGWMNKEKIHWLFHKDNHLYHTCFWVDRMNEWTNQWLVKTCHAMLRHLLLYWCNSQRKSASQALYSNFSWH